MAEIVDFGLQQHKIKMDSRYFENVLSVVAGDTGRRLEVQLLDTNGMVQDTTGLNLRLNAEIAGKATYTDATLVDAATGKYKLDLSNGMFLAPGNWQFQWQITDSAGKKLHSFAFTGNVGKNISEGGSQATNFYLNLEDLKAMQEDLVNGTIDSSILETNIAEKLTDLETQYAPKLTEVTAQLAHKANLTDVANIANGTPLFADSVAEMTDTTRLYANTTDGLIYQYNSTNLVFEATTIQYQSTGIADKSIEPKSTTFINQSENFFNKNDSRIITGKMIQYNGNVIDFVKGGISHKIKVKPNDVLTGYFAINRFGGSGKGYFYNESDAYISAVTPTLNGDIGTLTVPDNTEISYMLFNLDIDPATYPIETTMLVFGTVYPQFYIPFAYKLIREFALNETQKAEVDYKIANVGNKLNNKVIVFDGDSIANAINDPQDGWAGRIAENNNMAYTNYAVDGGTITVGLMAGTNPRHWVSRSVANYRADADYIILEGGTNDADLIGVPNMGEISYGFSATLDDTTFTGAVESTIKQAILKYSGKKIGFIIAHRMGSIDQQEVRRAFFDRIIEVCEKWGIPYLDVWKNSYLNSDIPELKAVYFSDKQHLTTVGYDLITPMIEDWVKSL